MDPGTSVMGYGLIAINGNTMTLMQYGVIQLSKFNGHELKLKKIFERVISLIDEFHPDEVALEAPFYGKNIQSMLKLGRAQGVAMAAALSREIAITEYAPKKVKQAVTGKGNASKEQVANMLQMLLKFDNTSRFLDATDALAVAVCHHFNMKAPVTNSKSWKSFLSNNPDRIK